MIEMLAATQGSTSEAIKGIINQILQPAPFFALSCIILGVFLLGYRVFTKPRIALLAFVAFTGAFLLSMFDHDFYLIITKPDNVPIVMMVYGVGLCMWLAFRQAAINDDRLGRGEPLLEAGSDDKVLVWPDLVYTELICMVLCTAALIVWAILLRAPLEQPADPVTIPNPSKAPWYFLGLQELLVYFDPWIAGVLLPGLIIFGLVALPYIDRNPRGNGYYTLKERPFAISMFLFGFVILWVVLIVFGTFLRGPNWNFFGPYEYWDAHKPVALVNVQMYELIWVKMFGGGQPTNLWVREFPGMVAMFLYFFVLPVLMAKTVFKKLYRQMGMARYATMMVAFTWMAIVPIKMVLRWTLDFKYFVNFKEFFFNV
jgi:hypothetical protein